MRAGRGFGILPLEDSDSTLPLFGSLVALLYFALAIWLWSVGPVPNDGHQCATVPMGDCATGTLERRGPMRTLAAKDGRDTLA